MKGVLSLGIVFLWLLRKKMRVLVIFIKFCFHRSLEKLFVSDLIGTISRQGLILKS